MRTRHRFSEDKDKPSNKMLTVDNRLVATKISHHMKSKKGRSEIEEQENVSDSVLVMDIQKRIAGPEYYARFVEGDAKEEWSRKI